MGKTITIARRDLYSKDRQKAKTIKTNNQAEIFDKETLIKLIKAMKQK